MLTQHEATHNKARHKTTATHHGAVLHDQVQLISCNRRALAAAAAARGALATMAGAAAVSRALVSHEVAQRAQHVGVHLQGQQLQL